MSAAYFANNPAPPEQISNVIDQIAVSLSAVKAPPSAPGASQAKAAGDSPKSAGRVTLRALNEFDAGPLD